MVHGLASTTAERLRNVCGELLAANDKARVVEGLIAHKVRGALPAALDNAGEGDDFLKVCGEPPARDDAAQEFLFKVRGTLLAASEPSQLGASLAPPRKFQPLSETGFGADTRTQKIGLIALMWFFRASDLSRSLLVSNASKWLSRNLSHNTGPSCPILTVGAWGRT
jgi:hypothetical protein